MSSWAGAGPGARVGCSSAALGRFSPVPLFVTPWTVAHQAPVSMGFSRQENTGVGCHFLPPAGGNGSFGGGNGSFGGESTFSLGSSELCLFLFLSA